MKPFLLALAIPSGLVLAQATEPTLPLQIRQALDLRYPGWTVAEISSEITAFLNNVKSPFPPNLVWGDFNSDGARDYAVMITYEVHGGSRQTVLAFLKSAGGYETHVLESGPLSLTTYLLTIEKGADGYDFSEDREFQYPHDAVLVWYIFGKNSAASYLYHAGGFRHIHSVD